MKFSEPTRASLVLPDAMAGVRHGKEGWEVAARRVFESARRDFAAEAHIPSRIVTLREAGKLRAMRPVTETLDAVRAGKRLLLLHGKPGTGKSVSAAEVLLAPVHRLPDGDPWFVGRWVTAAEYCEACYDHDRRPLVRDWQRTLYLVIDDLGLEQAHDRQRIEALIAGRYDGQAQVTILTTNLQGRDFKATYGPRVLSRIREVGQIISCSEVVRPGETQ